MSGVTCSVSRWTSNWKGISAFFVYTCSIVGNLGGWTSLDLIDGNDYQHTLYTIGQGKSDDLNDKLTIMQGASLACIFFMTFVLYAESIGKPDEDAAKSEMSIRIGFAIYFAAFVASLIVLIMYAMNHEDLVGESDLLKSTYSGIGQVATIIVCIFTFFWSLYYGYKVIKKYAKTSSYVRV
jgi:hypothetical protein